MSRPGFMPRSEVLSALRDRSLSSAQPTERWVIVAQLRGVDTPAIFACDTWVTFRRTARALHGTPACERMTGTVTRDGVTSELDPWVRRA